MPEDRADKKGLESLIRQGDAYGGTGPIEVTVDLRMVATGAACSGSFETCEQRTNGAFGPGGGASMTITAIGTPQAGILGGAVSGTLVGIFSLPPTFNATTDASYDLGGPAALTMPGTGTLCGNAMICP